jgi:hypothetical protein
MCEWRSCIRGVVSREKGERKQRRRTIFVKMPCSTPCRVRRTKRRPRRWNICTATSIGVSWLSVTGTCRSEKRRVSLVHLTRRKENADVPHPSTVSSSPTQARPRYAREVSLVPHRAAKNPDRQRRRRSQDLECRHLPFLLRRRIERQDRKER